MRRHPDENRDPLVTDWQWIPTCVGMTVLGGRMRGGRRVKGGYGADGLASFPPRRGLVVSPPPPLDRLSPPIAVIPMKIGIHW